ncbi:MAG: HNH endonuclease [Gammaproteobacteria bacterium]|nr:HNH endonuclease [Gammaproteobacteria bacterium]
MTFSDYFILDAANGTLTNRVSRGRAKKGDRAGSLCVNGYLAVKVCGTDMYVHRVIWEMAYLIPAPAQIDHVNGVKDDNRLCNLRAANNSENNSNRNIQSNNTSGSKGVSMHKHSGLWFAYATKNGKRISGGYHRSAEAAALAARAIRDRLHMEFCNHG